MLLLSRVWGAGQALVGNDSPGALLESPPGHGAVGRGCPGGSAQVEFPCGWEQGRSSVPPAGSAESPYRCIYLCPAPFGACDTMGWPVQLGRWVFLAGQSSSYRKAAVLCSVWGCACAETWHPWGFGTVLSQP